MDFYIMFEQTFIHSLYYLVGSLTVGTEERKVHLKPSVSQKKKKISIEGILLFCFCHFICIHGLLISHTAPFLWNT